ncbi:AraC family transcriptional regulator [Cohnella sp. JJ-181]|uniref:AraC family transcriptional regulator n=1 Tax=Cohnella rhizoplanae TaxID=2974897 RepID=UPI0022FFA161|nr:helix-turn-helix domain-containing protein [Cohnella sp. JJ-181]CAI6083123.1 HTH-type transcriptional activator RhaR [Cohnella sp. JJ-181]
MSILREYRSRRFFWRIVATNIWLVVLFLLFFCTIVYVYSRNATLSLQQDANRKVLKQVNYNIDNLNEMAKALTISAFNDRDLVSLMNTSQSDIFQLYNKLNKLDQIVSSNLFVRSVSIYNAHNRCTYSNSATAPVVCGDDGESDLQAYLRRQAEVPRLTFLPFVDREDGRDHDVFAYMMYNAVGGYKSTESVLMIEIKPEWLFDNIRTLNELADNSLGSVFLMDGAGRIYDASVPSFAAAQDHGELVEKLRGRSDEAGYFISGSGAGKQIVTYSTSKVNRWKVVSVQPYDRVFGKINQIGRFALIALAALVVISFVVSLIFSLRLYKPMGKLVSQLKLMPGRSAELGGKDKDELNFLSDVYANIRDHMTRLELMTSSNGQVLYDYLLKQWVTDSEAIGREQIERYAAGGKWLADGTFMFVLLLIDDYAAFRAERTEEERKLCKFAIGNIAGELLGGEFRTQTVDMENDRSVLLIRLPEGADAKPEETEALIVRQLGTLQETVADYYHLSLTAVLSEPIQDARRMTRHYLLAQRHARYRMIAGRASVITPRDYARQAGAGAAEQPPDEWFRKLADSIRAGNAPLMRQRLGEAIDRVASMHSDAIDEAIMQLMMLINQTIREMNQNMVQPPALDLRGSTRQVLEQETLADVRLRIERLLDELNAGRGAGKPDKPEFLIGAVKEMVEQNYTDANLSLQSIADALKMSSGYLGRYYRSKTSVSVADHINEVRLGHAAALLEQTDDSIVEIIGRTGFSNESYFFKLFKKRTGVTPNEYRLTHRHPR